MGISQMLSPGGVMGFKGTHGFMAPEILLYKGHEAYTEKVSALSLIVHLHMYTVQYHIQNVLFCVYNCIAIYFCKR